VAPAASVGDGVGVPVGVAVEVRVGEEVEVGADVGTIVEVAVGIDANVGVSVSVSSTDVVWVASIVGGVDLDDSGIGTTKTATAAIKATTVATSAHVCNVVLRIQPFLTATNSTIASTMRVTAVIAPMKLSPHCLIAAS
jgi:hypothetical protein